MRSDPAGGAGIHLRRCPRLVRKHRHRPAKPYLKAAWEVLMVTMACINELYQAYGYGMIVISSLKGIKKCLKEFGQ